MSSGTAFSIGSRPGSSVRWRRKGGEPRNSASSRRVNSPRSFWRLFGGDPARGSRVGTLGGGSSLLVSGAGRCAGLGAGRRTMLGSITTSFRPPTSTRCSILSRRTSLILRFPSSWTDSITPTRCDALRSRSHLSMFSSPANAVQSSHQLWRRPQVLGDISGWCSRRSRIHDSLWSVAARLTIECSSFSPTAHAGGYANRRGNCVVVWAPGPYEPAG